MSAHPEMLLERCQKTNNKAFYISSNCKDHGSAAWYSVQPVISLKSTQSVWLDTVLRQKHILKVRRRKTFISCFLCNIKQSSFRSLRCISLCIDEEKKSALLFLHLKAKQGKINSLAERLDIHWMNFLLFFSVYSVSCSEDKISHHFFGHGAVRHSPPVSSADSCGPVKSSFNLGVWAVVWRLTWLPLSSPS